MSDPIFSPLGQTVSYADQYDPGLLFPVQRQTQRDQLGIQPGRLPFMGADLWCLVRAATLSRANPSSCI